jgi:putative membrane protein
MKIKKAHLAILLINVIYLVIFTFLYSARKNYEFLMYVGTVAIFVTLIGLMHLRFDFPVGVLSGLTAWGLLHMLGGYVTVSGQVLYAYQLIPNFLRFDQLVHMFGFGCATLFSYYVLKPNLADRVNWVAVSILLVLIGMGLGALNEIIEFVAVLSFPQTGVGGYDNTMWDMLFNTVGAVLAVVYIGLRRAKVGS